MVEGALASCLGIILTVQNWYGPSASLRGELAEPSVRREIEMNMNPSRFRANNVYVWWGRVRFFRLVQEQSLASCL